MDKDFDNIEDISNNELFMSQELIDISKQKSKMARNPVKLTFTDLKYSVKCEYD